MLIDVYNCIIFDAKVDLKSCLKNEYLSYQLSENEISIIVPLIGLLLSSKSLGEFLDVSCWTIDYLKEKFPITDDVIEVWRTKGLSSYDKYSLTYFVVSHYLKVLRYRAKCLDKEN
jgi:hypothetical protein